MFEPNLHVAGALEELAFLLEITGGNPFKIRAYRQAARTLKSFPEPLEDVRQLDGIKGIGAGIKGIVEEVLSGALPEELRELRDQVPAGIFDIARLPGLGPKSLKTLMDSGITDLETLEEKAKDKSLAALPGFGQKTVERILESLEELKNHMDLHLGYDALLFARRLTDKICQFPGNKIIETQITGEVRRFAPQVTTVEIAVKTVPDFSEEDLAEFLLLESTGENGIYRHPEGYTVKLYFATDKDFGTVLLRTTGPEEFTSAFGELLDAP
ncbi:MAG TPA: helix-hairpin-helix domain-containing protein, partial [Bacillota bacterium]|nr:helix-hairpin-helix domain-containing protein [Bacillota bacterium]